MKDIKRNLALTGISLVLGVFADISPSYGMERDVISRESASHSKMAWFGKACGYVCRKTFGYSTKAVGVALLAGGTVVASAASVILLPANGLIYATRTLFERSETLHGTAKARCDNLGVALGLTAALLTPPGALLGGVGALTLVAGDKLLEAGDGILK
jgi:hypothetical protein